MALPFRCILFLFLSVLTVQTRSQSDGRISLGSSLLAVHDSSSWQSPSGEFAFGLRRLANQNLYLLAIWFDKIPDKTIVWYANGENPAPERSKIELSSDGQFTLNSPEGEVIWKPDPLAGDASHAALLDTGNFVLASNDSKYLWESFNHPTDTILPTQVLEINGILSSRQTKTSFSKGRFQLRLLPEGNLVLNTISLPTDFSYDPYYSSETKDDANSMNSGYRVIFNETGSLYVVRRNGNVVNLTSGNIASSRDFYHRATLDFDGIFTQYAHPKSPRSGSNWDEAWFSVWYEPKNICFDMTGDQGSGACGFNSFCSLDSYGRPTCECLPGFSLIDPSNKYSGCKQDRVQRCQPGHTKPEEVYEMSQMANVFWPTSANYERFPLSSEDVCTRSCLDDCNCVVAVIKDGTCWKKKLPLTNGRVERDTYGKAVIKIPKVDGSFREVSRGSSNGEKKDQSTLVLVVSVLLGSSLLLNFILVAATLLVAFYSYKKTERLNKGSSLLETNLRVFTYEELKEATDGFKEELGRGAFGTVYKGVLTSSESSKLTVAIKKLEKLAEEGEKEFKTEASTIARTHHKNLVRLLGFCDEKSNRLLVYEYMSNGTLASFLFGISRPDWNKRLQIAFGIARGIMYLHEECSTQIIHCDIKPQNILLDDSFTARISDFGLAKLLISDQTQTITAIRGTKGYVAPEWFRSAPVTSKVDVYSYGVMLLEIICCRKNVEVEREKEEEVILVDWVYDCYKERKIEQLVENDEEARNDMKRVERLVMVGIWCIQEDPSLRPLMKKVLQMLEGVVEVSLPPCPSPFTSIC